MDDEHWVMRDGRTIAIRDMTEQHAKAALRVLIRRLQERYDMERELIADCISAAEG